MKIHHIAIWTFRLEELREFYIRYFNGTSNEKYINPKKGFESYFIYFDDGAALELMSRTDVQNTPIEENGYRLSWESHTLLSLSKAKKTFSALLNNSVAMGIP